MSTWIKKYGTQSIMGQAFLHTHTIIENSKIKSPIFLINYKELRALKIVLETK